MKTTAIRYHDFSAGHRVVEHEGKCQHFHGHNYRVTFHCEAEQLDSLGRVVDFSVIKEKLCMWLEDNWDHKFIAWTCDPVVSSIIENENTQYDSTFVDSVVLVPFNPTAENMGDHLLNRIGPRKLRGSGVTLVRVDISETRKCSVTCELERGLHEG